ncbi:MAG: hypothetical protein ACFFER_02610 [Candidatus Thorarchaeota archaeon]
MTIASVKATFSPQRFRSAVTTGLATDISQLDYQCFVLKQLGLPIQSIAIVLLMTSIGIDKEHFRADETLNAIPNS